MTYHTLARSGTDHGSIRLGLYASVAAAALLIASPSFAQTPAAPPSAEAAPAEQPRIQDIIVTANRRAENIQKSSLAIQAFDSETLKSQGVAQAGDLSKLVQGLQVGFSGSTSQIYIRGVGDFSANPLANPGVAFNVDGVYVGRPEAVGVNFFDVERLEVLKGPQGTLYGRNSSGGAINLITGSPSLTAVKGFATAEVGNYGLLHFEGAVNLPLGDKFAVRAAFNRIKRNGYLSDGTSDDDQIAGRVKLLFQPSDSVRLVISADGERVRGKGGGYVNLPRRPGSSAWEGAGSVEGADYARTFNPFVLLDANGNKINTSDSYVHNDFWNISAQLDADLGFANLTVIPAYRYSKTDTLSYNAQVQHLLGTARQQTFEVRLGKSNNQLKWVLGGYYFHEHNPGEIRVFVGAPLLKSKPTYDPAGTSYAAFGEATYSVTNAFRLIAGARYTTEKRTLNGTFFVYPNYDDITVFPALTFKGEKRFNAFTWKGGAEYDLGPRSMLYFTASKGFKAGGLTQTVAPNNVYQPEKVLALELGSRNRFFDNKLQLNLEAFHWTYTDQQVAHLTFDTNSAIGVNFLTQNAGRAKVYGLNVDLVFKPTGVDTFRVAGEYDHSRYGDFRYSVPGFAFTPLAVGCPVIAPASPGVTTVQCAGFPLPHAPKWSGTAGYTHSFAMQSGAAVDFDVNGRFASKSWLAVDFIQSELAPSFAVLNASLTYQSPARNYSLSAFVRNINNGKEYTGTQEQNFAPPLNTANIGAPRTYGVRANVRF